MAKRQIERMKAVGTTLRGESDAKREKRAERRERGRSCAKAAEAGAESFPTVGLGQTVRVSDDRLAAAALVAEDRVAHLAAFELGMQDGRS